MTGCRSSVQLPENTVELMAYYQENGKAFFGSPLSGAFLVAKNDRVLYRKGIGDTSPESRTPITPDTRFYIGSLSKQFTACLVLLLAQENKLDLHKPISAYLPNYPKEKGDKITVHQLLSHTSGIPHYRELVKFGYTAETFFTKPIAIDDYVRLIGKLDLKFTPGAQFYYSSFGYILLGAIIERVTQERYQTVLKDKIATPLSLENTGYSPGFLTAHVAADKKFAGGWFGKNAFEEIPERDLSTAFSAGGLYSSLNDLFKWAQAIRHKRILDPEHHALFLTPVRRGYSYGLFKNPEALLRKNHNVQLYFHGGAIMGYRSALALYEDGTTIVLLCNTLPMQNRTSLITQLHLSASGETRPVKHFIHPSLRNLPHFYEEGGLDGFDQYHAKLSEVAGYSIYPSSSTMRKVIEMHLGKKRFRPAIKTYVQHYVSVHPALPEELINTMGYAFLKKGEPGQAIALFEENISRYPNSPNVYDSLGEALEKIGEKEKAKINYAKALALAHAQNDLNAALYQKNLERVTD